MSALATRQGGEHGATAFLGDEVFTVPLAHVLDLGNFVVEARRWQGRWRHYYAVPFGPYYIWGATARMLRGWAEAVQS